ncbi:hypothetical protein GINT2_000999 [Glugoides intestinalis]
MQRRAYEKNNELLKFHESCRDDYKILLEHFNILFYGYGNKERILEALFPDAIKFNMLFSTQKSICEDLVLQGYGKRADSSIKDIDSWLGEEKKDLQLIITNFQFDEWVFTGLKNIKIIGTIESIDIKFDLTSLEDFNFIFRDLTTFEDYEDDIINIELFNNKVQSVQMILSNLSTKARTTFKELLLFEACTLNELFNKVKKDLFLTKPASLIDLLREFIDHKIIKIQDGRIKTILNKTERKTVMEFISNLKK